MREYESDISQCDGRRIPVIAVSNPTKVIFPAAGFTKADVVAHYERVGDQMLHFLGGRPLTLQRFPKGIGQKGFMQKNAGKHFPNSIGRHAVPKRDGTMTNYAVVHQVEDLAYLANQGVVTFHMWMATAAEPDRPTWMVLDLDPEAQDLAGVRFATAAVGDLLDEFGLEGFVVATGSKGFHVWVPIDGKVGFGGVSLATRAIASILAVRFPDRLTVDFLKKDRAGRVFVDWLRSTPIATTVVPFSLRPRPGAPVAVPMYWHELEDARPDGWTLDNLGDRFDVHTAIAAQPLPVDDIVALARAVGADLDTPHDRFGRTRSS